MLRQRSDANKKDGDAKQQQRTQEERSAAAWDDGDDTFTLEDGVEDEVHEGNADPLSFSADAILDTVPPALTAALGGDAKLAGRVWATSLVAAYLESSDAGWRTRAARRWQSSRRCLTSRRHGSARSWRPCPTTICCPTSRTRRASRSAAGPSCTTGA
jgi:hypothetical protein